MDRLFFATIVSLAFVCIQCAYEADLVLKDDGNNTVNGSYQIIQGNCSTALVKDEVFREHVYKLAIPFIQRNATSTWYGDETIYCLEVLNDDDDNSTAGIAYVKKGGVGHHFVTVEMHSKTSHGMEFDVIVYGKFK